MRLAARALRHDGRGDLPARPDPVRGLAGRLAGHPGQERTSGGADEATQTGQRGDAHVHDTRGRKGCVCIVQIRIFIRVSMEVQPDN